MTALTSPVTLTPLLGFPEVHTDDDLASMLLKALPDNGIDLLDGDVLVVSSKVASKAMGLFSPSAQRADVVLSQTVRVVAERITPWGVTRIVESAAGPVMTAAGVDASNTADPSIVLVLPSDPDDVAAQIRDSLQTGWAELTGDEVLTGVILSDTAGRPWRIGQTDFALGAAGIHLVDDLRGLSDADGRTLSVTERCIADEIASAADLVKGKTAGVPVAHIRGLGRYVRGDDVPGSEAPGNESASGARGLVRTGPGDWFGLGRSEAVRAALGVEPGSAEATAVGIPAIDGETFADKANRALRVALLLCPDAAVHLEGDTVHMVAADEFSLGVVTTRAQVALRGEGLAATLIRAWAGLNTIGETPPVKPSAVIVLREE